MILSFKKQFINKILDGTKIHTIRTDTTDRWKSGKLIHFATNVRTKNYWNFKQGVCISTQQIEIRYNELNDVKIFVDGKKLTLKQQQELARNDGFDCFASFLLWFNDDFTGKIIHWTDFKY